MTSAISAAKRKAAMCCPNRKNAPANTINGMETRAKTTSSNRAAAI